MNSVDKVFLLITLVPYLERKFLAIIDGITEYHHQSIGMSTRSNIFSPTTAVVINHCHYFVVGAFLRSHRFITQRQIKVDCHVAGEVVIDRPVCLGTEGRSPQCQHKAEQIFYIVCFHSMTIVYLLALTIFL